MNNGHDDFNTEDMEQQKGKLEQIEHHLNALHGLFQDAQMDVTLYGTMLTEMEALKTENEQLKAENESLKKQHRSPTGKEKSDPQSEHQTKIHIFRELGERLRWASILRKDYEEKEKKYGTNHRLALESYEKYHEAYKKLKAYLNPVFNGSLYSHNICVKTHDHDDEEQSFECFCLQWD